MVRDRALENNAAWACPPAARGGHQPALSAAAYPIPLPVLAASPGWTGVQPAAARDAEPTSLVAARVQELLDVNREQQEEILRCNERLGVVLDLSESSALADEPAALEQVLLQRYASTLNADALLIDYGDDRVARVAVPPRERAIPVDAETIASVISEEIETARRARRAVCINATESRGSRAAGMHVLLGALLTDADQPHVVVALRDGEQAPFDHHDTTSAETVLVYGGHLLRNFLMVRRLQQVSLEVVASLANAIEARDAYTGGHSERVGWLAVMIGEEMGLNRSDLQMLEWTGLLHDVGKIGIAERILNKPGKLTPEEFADIERHPRLGYEVLRPLSGLKPVLDAVLYHHENYDGSGYPDGLKGDQIPLFARILRVVDIFDALTSTRSYRSGRTVEEALEILSSGAGETTDPDVTSVFGAAIRKRMNSESNEFCRLFPHLQRAGCEAPAT